MKIGGHVSTQFWALSGLIFAALTSSALELLGPPHSPGWSWPYARAHLGRCHFRQTWVDLALASLALSAIASWYLVGVVPSLQAVYSPPPPPQPSSYSYGSYSYEVSSGSYSYESSSGSYSYEASSGSGDYATSEVTSKATSHAHPPAWAGTEVGVETPQAVKTPGAEVSNSSKGTGGGGGGKGTGGGGGGGGGGGHAPAWRKALSMVAKQVRSSASPPFALDWFAPRPCAVPSLVSSLPPPLLLRWTGGHRLHDPHLDAWRTSLALLVLLETGGPLLRGSHPLPPLAWRHDDGAD